VADDLPIIPNSGDSAAADQRRDAFARLFAKYDRWLFPYLVTLLANPAHAEEVFQEVCVTVWRISDQFDLGTDFVKWVSVIAHNQVRKFRRESKRGGFQLSDVTCERLAADAARGADLFDFRVNDGFYGLELHRGDGNGYRVLCIGNGADGPHTALHRT
jgi:RNA polymerase sigma-70 factor (ECF subfamily)